MTIHWELLVAVFVVSLSSAVAVVVLVALALVALSARVERSDVPARYALFPLTRATVCFAAAAVIVLFGLWAIVGR